MSSYTVIRQSKNSPSPNQTLVQIGVMLAGGLVLFTGLLIAAVILFNLANLGKVYPGVSMTGVSLAGLTKAEASDKLARSLLYPQNGKVVLESGERIWVAPPAQLGLSLDFSNNAQAAFEFGRRKDIFTRLSDQAKAYGKGVDLAPFLKYDEEMALAFLTQIAAEVDLPTVEASLKLDGVNVVAVPGQVGRTLDVAASLEKLQGQIRTLSDGVVPLVVKETRPEILDASQQAETARKILSESFTLNLPDAKEGDPGPWKIPPSQLAEMLKIERQGEGENSQIRVGLSEEALYVYLTALAGDIDRSPANARFMFNDDTHKLEVIQPAAIGRGLDVYSTINTVNEKIAAGEHSANLTLVINEPEVGDDATGAELGITENLVTYTSYFRGSTNERLQNIQTAAANFHGLLIAPGETFSMASVMGNVSLDTGYAEAWIIFGGRTIKGVGGGVCQVSTTLFRTAFLAGFPIVERHPHAYRVGYYEQTAGGLDEDYAGLDATVFVPMVDFKFVNDSPYWLLMETYFYPNSRSLTWKFYSTSDGRSVDWDTTGPENVIEPPDPLFEENPDLENGEVKQVDWAAEGADVTVTRTVTRDGQIILSDSFYTHYLPWADVYQYGPGTNLNKLIKKKTTPPIFTR